MSSRFTAHVESELRFIPASARSARTMLSARGGWAEDAEKGMWQVPVNLLPELGERLEGRVNW